VVRHALVLGFASLSLVARDPGCGSAGSSSNGPNAPCTRNYDCASGLSCLSGVCSGPPEDAAATNTGDAGNTDAGDSGAEESGAKDAGGDG
jgi:hypothetical protein